MDSPNKTRRATQAVRPIEDRRIAGIGLILCAVFLFSCLDSCAKWLVVSGVPPFEVVFVRYLTNFLLALAFFAPGQGLSLFRSGNIRLEVLRGAALMGSSVFNFFAVRYLPLTVTGSIAFSMPLILCGLSVPLLGEKVGWRRWVAIAVGFCGVLVIVRPGGAEFHWAMLLSVATATCAAFYSVFTRKLAGRDPTTTQQIYATGLATVCLMPPALASGWQWPADNVGWFALFAAGVFGGLGHLLVTIAHRFAPASVLAPFNYFQIIWMTTLSWIIFAQPPSVSIFIGAPIVVGSGLYIWIREKQLAIRPHVAHPDD